MICFNKDIGNYGEDISTNYLLANGYEILERNYKNKIGEIDIICKYSDVIVFVEVKSRYSSSYGSPLEAVTYSKQKRIINISSFYILTKKFYNYNLRFDVIEVIFNNINNNYIVNHIEDAFR